jgi:hypothetical protein
MGRQKTIDTKTGSDAVPAAARHQPAVLVPRWWLFALGALLIVPWTVVAALYLGSTRGVAFAGAEPPPAAPAPRGTVGRPGPWGRIETSPIVISPPLEYLPEDPAPPQRPVWRFPQTTVAQLGTFLEGAGFPRDQAASIVSAARVDPSIGGVVVMPDPNVVWALQPEARKRLYLALAGTPLNPRHEQSFRFYGPSIDAWLGLAHLPPAIVDLVRPLAFQHDGFVYVADIDLLRERMGDTPEFRRLTKALLRDATLVARLHLDDQTAVDAVAEYWGRGGRRTDVRPLLESVALGPGATIDVTHLLPSFARDHLYRYPQITLADLEKPSLVNCFWTALNFFNQKPDDRFLQMPVVLETLKRDYHLVHDQFQLGDVVVFTDRGGNLYHAAVHIADGLVFGKNGNSSLAPWTLMPTERVRGYYPHRAEGGSVSYYRRNDM